MTSIFHDQWDEIKHELVSVFGLKKEAATNFCRRQLTDLRQGAMSSRGFKIIFENTLKSLPEQHSIPETELMSIYYNGIAPHLRQPLLEKMGNEESWQSISNIAIYIEDMFFHEVKNPIYNSSQSAQPDIFLSQSMITHPYASSMTAPCYGSSMPFFYPPLSLPPLRPANTEHPNNNPQPSSIEENSFLPNHSHPQSSSTTRPIHLPHPRDTCLFPTNTIYPDSMMGAYALSTFGSNDQHITNSYQLPARLNDYNVPKMASCLVSENSLNDMSLSATRLTDNASSFSASAVSSLVSSFCVPSSSSSSSSSSFSRPSFSNRFIHQPLSSIYKRQHISHSRETPQKPSRSLNTEMKCNED
ncbi:hypothetical protein BDF14DRAFT_1858605 [Spinellus fusiger]|nr:hypothetical protein BDF14DRAFT_1858605 [Spinellus fusiger]